MKEDLIMRYFDGMDDAAQRMLRQIHKEIGKQDVGVTGSQYMVLKKLHENGNMTVSKVADDLGVSLSAVTALIDRLCKVDLASRRRDDKDRRLVRLEITPTGKEKVKICDDSRRRVLAKYFGKLTENDLTRLIEINEKFVQILKEEEQE